MAGRPKIFNEAEVLDKAVAVFWDKCYDAASADELLEGMGIGKGSFYNAFKGGKKELYQRSLERFAQKFQEEFKARLEASDNKIEHLKSYFRSMAVDADSFAQKGCFMGNALVQLSDKDVELRTLAGRLLGNLQQLFTATLVDAQKQGYLQSTKNPEVLAWHLMNLWNGLHVTRRMGASTPTLKALVELNLKLLN